MADEPRNVRASADSPANFGLHRRGQGRDAVSVTRFCRERRAIAECESGMEPNERSTGETQGRDELGLRPSRVSCSVSDLRALRARFRRCGHARRAARSSPKFRGFTCERESKPARKITAAMEEDEEIRNGRMRARGATPSVM